MNEISTLFENHGIDLFPGVVRGSAGPQAVAGISSRATSMRESAPAPLFKKGGDFRDGLARHDFLTGVKIFLSLPGLKRGEQETGEKGKFCKLVDKRGNFSLDIFFFLG